ncbi:MAG: Gfo/Idh/MocA family oxidoreductase [Candidatus Latescibacteria bacterium]|nr:Gfo/Idh/MocA family oxidoreductase [Candidatus Latescibacterota bacterium]
MSEQARVGFVGAGGMASAHLKQLETVQSAEVVAICDLQEEMAKEAAEPLGAKVYTDYQAMLDSQNLDAAYVVVPPFAHGEIEREVIRRGLAIFVEKPVALSMGLANEISSLIAEKGLISGVGYQLRFLPSVQRARAFLQDRSLAMMVGRYWSSMISEGWWPLMDKSGGQVVEQATHIVDLMRYLGGEVVEVAARTGRLTGAGGSHVDVPDTCIAHLTFESGAFGSLTTACMSGDWQLGIDMLVSGDDEEDGCRLAWTFDNLEAAPDEVELPEADGSAPTNIDEVFIESVQTGQQAPVICSYEDAVKTLGVTLAVNESAASGNPVQL